MSGEHVARGGESYMQDFSPALLQASDASAGDVNELRSGSPDRCPEHTAQEWQLVDHRSLSQCGSSPRSLSQIDLELPDTSPCLTSAPSEVDESVAPEVDPSDQQSFEEIASLAAGMPEQSEGLEEELSESLPTSLVAANQDLSSAGDSLAAEEGFSQTEGDSDFSAISEDSGKEGIEDGSDDQQVSSDEDKEGLQPLLSGQSSYADITMPASQGTEAEETATESSEDSHDASMEDGHDLSLDEAANAHIEQQIIPDMGVCTIVTGYPVDTPFEQSSSGSPGSGSHMDFARLSDESPLGSFSARRSTSGSSRTSSLLPPASESHWARWMRMVGNSHAGRMLKQMWGTLQVYARRLGATIPPKLKARMQSLLHYLDGAKMLPQSDKGRSCMLLSGFALVSVLLAYACFENCSLSRALRARDAEMQQHILTILDLNNKLTSSVDIPITRHCSYKTSLSLSSTIF